MDEKTLKDKLRELVEEIMGETYCCYCGSGTIVYDEDDEYTVEVILRFILELTQE